MLQDCSWVRHFGHLGRKVPKIKPKICEKTNLEITASNHAWEHLVLAGKIWFEKLKEFACAFESPFLYISKFSENKYYHSCG